MLRRQLNGKSLSFIVEMALLGALVFILTFYSKPARAADPVRIQTILELHKAEPYAALLVHGGIAWTGHSREDKHPYRLYAFHPSGKPVLGLVNLPHSVSYLYPYGDNAILVLGKSFSDKKGWRTHYSIVNFAKQQVWKAKTYTFGASVQADQFAGTTKQMYFSDPGSRRVVQPGSLWESSMKPELFGPGEMLLAGNHLFVIERPGLGLSNLVRIDLKTQKAERLFDQPVGSLMHLKLLREFSLLAVSEFRGNRVLLIDPLRFKVTTTLKVDGTPRDLALVGRCLAVVAQSERAIKLYDLSRKSMPEVVSWDLRGGGKRLENPIYLAHDMASGTFWVRSIAPCVFCEQSSASVATVKPTDATTLKACF